MNTRKRQASDTPSTRRHKQPRLTLKGYDGGSPTASEKEGLLCRWNRFRMELLALSFDTLNFFFKKFNLGGQSDQREPNSPSSSSSQQISSPAAGSLLSNGSPDPHSIDYPTSYRTAVLSHNATAPQRKDGIVSTDINGRLRGPHELPPETKIPCLTQQTQTTLEDIQISNQVTPIEAVNSMVHSSVLRREALLKSERDTQEPEYRHRQPCTYGRSEDADLPSTSRTTSLSLLKDSPFPPADSSLTSWSSVKDDLSDRTKSFHLDSSSSSRSSQPFRFSTTSPNSHLPPSLRIPSRKSSIVFRRRTSGHYHRNRPHILEKVHKAKVRRGREELREELKEYKSKRRTGKYSSSFEDFLGYKDYEKTLQDINLDMKPYPQSPKPLQGDPNLEMSRWRSIEAPENLVRRALDSANATLNSPKPPKPYIPNLDQIHISHRTRDEEIERRIRSSATPLPPCLPPADDANVSAILLRRGVISKFAREQVSDQDIARLEPGQWLNDEVVNFYGAMILARSEGSKENPGSQRNGKTTKNATFLDAHYFSSFFWSKLTKEGYERGRLAKWTKKIDIFSKDIILIPVNHQNAHWTAAAINFKEKRVESYDSMGMAKEKVFMYLRSYLNAEHMNKRKKPFDFADWKNWAPDATPQQENGYDCGVFTSKYALSTAKDDMGNWQWSAS